jgi:hypothetical protein
MFSKLEQKKMRNPECEIRYPGFTGQDGIFWRQSLSFAHPVSVIELP